MPRKILPPKNVKEFYEEEKKVKRKVLPPKNIAEFYSDIGAVPIVPILGAKKPIDILERIKELPEEISGKIYKMKKGLDKEEKFKEEMKEFNNARNFLGRWIHKYHKSTYSDNYISVEDMKELKGEKELSNPIAQGVYDYLFDMFADSTYSNKYSIEDMSLYEKLDVLSKIYKLRNSKESKVIYEEKEIAPNYSPDISYEKIDNHLSNLFTYALLLDEDIEEIKDEESSDEEEEFYDDEEYYYNYSLSAYFKRN